MESNNWHLALLDPCGLAACSNPPVVPSGPRGVSVPSGLFGVPPYSPACPPVAVVETGEDPTIATALPLL
jgi:hypothetical protein